MTDISCRADIDSIMRLFYSKLLADKRINYLFTEVAQLNLEPHFEVLNDFWEAILFGTATYQNNALLKHIELSQKSQLSATHFKIWLQYLDEAIFKLFEGEKSNEMHNRARQIAKLMQFKVKAT
jgi:hemoglobin